MVPLVLLDPGKHMGFRDRICGRSIVGSYTDVVREFRTGVLLVFKSQSSIEQSLNSVHPTISLALRGSLNFVMGILGTGLGIIMLLTGITIQEHQIS